MEQASRSEDPLRLGLVGCGRLAERAYVAAARRASGIELAAVADVDLARCAAVAPGVPAYRSAAELIAARAADAVVLATPVAAHVADARRAAAAGLPTLVEKPPAADVDGALELARLEPPPWLGLNRRFDPTIAALREAIPRDGPLEVLVDVTTRRASWEPLVVADDVLLDLGPHVVDLACWLAGADVTAVAASVSSRQADLQLELAGGRGFARGRCANDGVYAELIEVRDLNGRVVVAWRTGGLREAITARIRRPAEHPLVASLARQLEAFARAARGSSEPDLAPATAGVALMRVFAAARESARRGGTSMQVSPTRD